MTNATIEKALLDHAPLLLKWISSTDLNPEAVERGRQLQRFINALRAYFATCNRCRNPLKEPGALIFGPPGPDGKSKKLHVCVGCWAERPTWAEGAGGFEW